MSDHQSIGLSTKTQEFTLLQKREKRGHINALYKRDISTIEGADVRSVLNQKHPPPHSLPSIG